jgi:hypothetical protein
MDKQTSISTDGTGAEAILEASLSARGPNVIGATGGSGTRVVARIVREAGMFTGHRLNDYEDALDFGEYSDRWIDRYLAADRNPAPALATEMTADLRALVIRHCADMDVEVTSWGWKEPRSIYLLPFLHAAMPSLRFLHFVRDGRDMALSANQTQLVKHGGAVLREGRVSWRRQVRSIALWSRVNTWAADYGEQRLGPSYLRVRFEDLCVEPAAVIGRILDFFGLEGEAELAASLVKPPATLGRWHRERRRSLARMEGVGGDGLRRLGYL